VAFQNGSGLKVYKIRGKLRDLQSILPNPAPVIEVGLGHTRWATHGAPSSVNAHPHRVESVAVVHNGIIENYRELKSHLENEGQRFLSETDTEVVPQLISKYIRQGLSITDAIRTAIAQLRGTYALGIISESCPATLFAVRKGSPLVLGIGNVHITLPRIFPPSFPIRGSSFSWKMDRCAPSPRRH
jgi:glucosamine--fructose-6-phosphate aminotransferase (isomerizing)